MGLVANVNYNRNIGHWELGANYGYNQNVQTLLAIYQTPSMNYTRTSPRRFRMACLEPGRGGGRTAFEQMAGNGSNSESVNSSVSWHRTTLGGNYSQSYGTSVLTPTGLVPVPVPIISNNLVVFNGKSRGREFRHVPAAGIVVSAWPGQGEQQHAGPERRRRLNVDQ